MLFARETFDEIWPEMKEIAAEHFVEVDGGLDSRRPFAPDESLMRQLDRIGSLQFYSARREAKLVGYVMWSLSFDAESMGLTIANQGPWFAKPGHGRMAFELFRFSLQELKAQGVRLVFLHHRLAGRATWRLGEWFQRIGAKPEQVNYRLWIEDLKGGDRMEKDA